MDSGFESGFGKWTQLHHLLNATKCMRWHDIRASHMKEDHEVIINLDDTYGLMILLASGLGGALVILIVELLTKAKKPRWKKSPKVLGNWMP